MTSPNRIEMVTVRKLAALGVECKAFCEEVSQKGRRT